MCLALTFLEIGLSWCSNDRAKALDILMKDLKVFAAGNEELFREMTQLLTLDDFRYMFCTSLLISDFL